MHGESKFMFKYVKQVLKQVAYIRTCSMHGSSHQTSSITTKLNIIIVTSQTLNKFYLHELR